MTRIQVVMMDESWLRMNELERMLISRGKFNTPKFSIGSALMCFDIIWFEIKWKTNWTAKSDLDLCLEFFLPFNY